jgi:MraZ protein
MFYGEFEHTLDRKGRLIIPSKFREALKEAYSEKLYLTRGFEKSLFIFTEEEWKAQEAKFKAMPFVKSENRKFNRIFFSGAQELIPDKQGRILLPAYLKEFASIKRDVVFIGVSNRIEVWSK